MTKIDYVFQMKMTLMIYLFNMEPEIIIDKPHPTNNFKWCWSICQPDANYGELYGGSSETLTECLEKSRFYLNLAINEMEIENEYK